MNKDAQIGLILFTKFGFSTHKIPPANTLIKLQVWPTLNFDALLSYTSVSVFVVRKWTKMNIGRSYWRWRLLLCKNSTRQSWMGDNRTKKKLSLIHFPLLNRSKGVGEGRKNRVLKKKLWKRRLELKYDVNFGIISQFRLCSSVVWTDPDGGGHLAQRKKRHEIFFIARHHLLFAFLLFLT